GKGEGEQHCKQLFHDDFSLHIKFGEKFYVGVGPCRGFDRFAAFRKATKNTRPLARTGVKPAVPP
ncbi:hypothetical protein, partial [uncultured Anaerotruncus sp.]|uniref:hypothetical protein n=1 Tax=Anaerotruncus massiliensis (ex Liu et al. 2021) TaxID=2321404 RepID=UPI00267190E3